MMAPKGLGVTGGRVAIVGRMDRPTRAGAKGDTVETAQQQLSELQRRRWYALIVVSVGSFMTPFDASIVAVALPAMGENLQLSYSQGLWAQAAYLLVTSVLLIPAGRVADSRGPVGYYLLGTVIFALGSVGAALSPNGLILIFSRCVQGVGGAFVFATAVAIVTAAFPARERGRALGLNTMATYLGLTAGPVIGGLIVTHFSWRWIFFINVPIALATLLVGWNLIGVEHRDRLAERELAGPGAGAKAAGTGGAVKGTAGDAALRLARAPRRVDVLGAVILGGMLVALFVPLTYSPLWGWGTAKVIAPLAVAVALFVGFILAEDRVREPMLDLDLLRKNRVFAAANSAVFLNYMAVFAATTLTAVYLEIAQGRSAQQAGLLLLAQPVLMAALSPFTGRLSDRIGSRVLATTGMVLIGGGMAQLAFVSSSAGRVLLALGTIGVGMACFSAPIVSAIMGSVGRSQLSLASGFLSTMRFTGQGISMAVLGAIAAWRLGAEGGRIILLGETGSGASASAFADGYQVAMLVGAALALVGAAISWSAKSRGNAG
ncbi:MAG: MFS transporter [bacterium]